MDEHLFSRRNLLLAGATGVTLPLASAAPLTAGEVVSRIQKNVGIPWRTVTVDKIVAGDDAVPVRGIATTMMATLGVLKRSIAAGKNLVITHETPFYLHQDQTADLADDPTYQFKLNYIREQGMAIFHFHDHWHARHPDGIATGMAQELGWTRYADGQDPRRFLFPGVPLQRLALEMQSRLQIRTMRVVGDPQLVVRQARASWGFVSRMPGIPQFREPGVDLYIAGETREWELVEYVQDSITKGDKKALIILGHVVSEQSGIKHCAEWLKSFVSEVPVEFIAAQEPFWNPRQPITG